MTEKFRQATYKELGYVLGISRQAVAYKMQSRGEFTLSELAKLYDEYGISMWELQNEIEIATESIGKERRKDYGRQTKITLYDILMLCGQEELVDIVYNGYPVVVCKAAGDLCDLLEVLDDEILNSLVFKLEDLYGNSVSTVQKT